MRRRLGRPAGSDGSQASLLALLLLLLCGVPPGHVLAGTAAHGTGFRHWLGLRDAGVERQVQDYSCGLASLATILRYDYGQAVSEASLLALVEDSPGSWQLPRDWQRRGVSLATLQRLALHHDFEALGVAVDAATLARLVAPAIAYLEDNGVAHFTVIRGVTPGGLLHLADPSRGNRHMSMREFLPLWQRTVDGKKSGRLLLLRPGPGNPASLRREHFRDRVLRPLLLPPALSR